MNPKFRALIKKGLAKYGYRIQPISPPEKPDPIHLWYEDTKFLKLLEQISGYTVVDDIRCFIIYQYAKIASGLPGNAAEVGVYQGGTAKLIAKIFAEANKILHLFDTFSGMPPSDPTKDIHKKGDFADTSLKAVKIFLKDFKNVRFHKGIFPDTAKSLSRKKFCFVHIDADLYKSVMDSCVFFYPRMKKGGVLIFDDYGCVTCPGAKKAVDEFFSNKPESPVYLPTGQCILTRL